jgi:hypothetical protein
MNNSQKKYSPRRGKLWRIQMRPRPFHLIAIALLVTAYASSSISVAAESIALPFAAVSAEESGLTHIVKLKTTEDTIGLGMPWMSPLVDINGDGYLDICYYGHHGGGAAIWLGKKGGSFTLDTWDYSARWVFSSRAPLWWHINDDNFIDGISSQALPGGILYMNDGTGHWNQSGISLLPARTWYPKLLDGNGDGHHDELSVNGRVYSISPPLKEWGKKLPEKAVTKELWEVESIISWPKNIEHSRGTGFEAPYCVDLDGDHKNEIIVHFKEGFIRGTQFLSYVLSLDENSKGTTQFIDTTADRGLPNDGAFFPEDWDGDGDLDLIDIYSGFWYVNDGTGKFAKSDSRLFELGNRPEGTYSRFGYFVGDGTVDMLDLDNDGRRDLSMAGHHAAEHGYILNLGDGKTKEVNNIPVYCTQRAIGDVDNDGDLDFVAKGKEGGPTMVLFRNETKSRGLFVRIVPRNSPEQQLGCKVWVYEAGKMENAAGLISYRQGFMLNTASKAEVLDGRLHIGIGTRTEVDIRVRFPSGEIREAKGVKPGVTTDIKE